MKSFECYRGKKSAAKPQLPNSEKGRGRPARDVDLSEMPAHIQPTPRRWAPASIRKHPGNSISRARAPASSSPTEGSGRTSGTSIAGGLNHTNIRPSSRWTSEYGAGATTAGGGTQPNRQVARLRAASFRMRAVFERITVRPVILRALRVQASR
jgi:hypothetical protein